MTQNSPPNGASPQETADAPQPEESAFSGNRPEAQIPATPGAQKFLAALALVAPLTLLALAAALARPFWATASTVRTRPRAFSPIIRARPRDSGCLP